MDEAVFAFGTFRLIPAQRMLFEDGKPVRLGGRALDILALLTERAAETISKEELIARAWPDTFVEEAALRAHVSALRKALGDGRAGNRYIANLSGRGYAFIAPVTRENALSATAPTRIAETGNLPALLTRVVGRDGVIPRGADQLVRRRLLTIVGPGGIGKTTVVVAVADRARASYQNGAWYVELAPLSDPDLVGAQLKPMENMRGWPSCTGASERASARSGFPTTPGPSSSCWSRPRASRITRSGRSDISASLAQAGRRSIGYMPRPRFRDG